MGKKFEKIINLILYIVEGILEVIYPREDYCIICREENYNGLCTKCKNSIRRIKDNSSIIKKY